MNALGLSALGGVAGPLVVPLGAVMLEFELLMSHGMLEMFVAPTSKELSASLPAWLLLMSIAGLCRGVGCAYTAAHVCQSKGQPQVAEEPS